MEIRLPSGQGRVRSSDAFLVFWCSNRSCSKRSALGPPETKLPSQWVAPAPAPAPSNFPYKSNVFFHLFAPKLATYIEGYHLFLTPVRCFVGLGGNDKTQISCFSYFFKYASCRPSPVITPTHKISIVAGPGPMKTISKKSARLF